MHTFTRTSSLQHIQSNILCTKHVYSWLISDWSSKNAHRHMDKNTYCSQCKSYSSLLCIQKNWIPNFCSFYFHSKSSRVPELSSVIRIFLGSKSASFKLLFTPGVSSVFWLPFISFLYKKLKLNQVFSAAFTKKYWPVKLLWSETSFIWQRMNCFPNLQRRNMYFYPRTRDTRTFRTIYNRFVEAEPRFSFMNVFETERGSSQITTKYKLQERKTSRKKRTNHKILWNQTIRAAFYQRNGPSGKCWCISWFMVDHLTEIKQSCSVFNLCFSERFLRVCSCGL